MDKDYKKYLELQEKEDIYLGKRRSKAGVRQIIFRSRTKQTPKCFELKSKYTFLQYIHMAYEWAERKTQYTREEIDFLLYAYPIGIFNQYQVKNMIKTSKLNRKVTLGKLIKKGAIKTWREKRGNQHELYKLSEKASHMCARMHLIIANEKELPSSRESVFDPKKKANNKYYLEIIKEMNSKVGSDSN